MLLLCYPKCSTCQATKKALEESNVGYQERNIKKENPTYEEIKKWWKQSKLPLKRFFNTSGQLYKSMQLKDKLIHMSEEEQIRLLATDGMLVKRSLAIEKERVLLGKKDILSHYLSQK